MKIRLLGDGNDGSRHIVAGSEYEGDSDWVRRLLINGHAEPLDDQAHAIVKHPEQITRYKSDALTESAKSLAPLSTDQPQADQSQPPRSRR